MQQKKSKNKIWRADVTIGGRRYRKRGFLSKQAAKLWEHNKRVEYENRVLGKAVDDDACIENVMRRFLKEWSPNKKPATVDRVRLGLRHWSRFFKENNVYSICELKLSDGLKYREWRQGQVTPSGNKPNQTTVNHEMKAIRQCFKWAHDWEVIGQNPLHRVPLYENVRNAPSVCLSEEDIEIIEREAKKDVAKTCLYEAFAILVRTGMRSGEVCRLKISDINFELEQIYLCGDTTKSGYARTIPIGKNLKSLLQDFVVKAQKGNSEYLIYTKNKTGQNVNGLSSRFKKLLERLYKENLLQDITGVKIHSLRSTYISHMVMKGVELVKVMEIVGHRDYKTFKRYMHLSPGYTKKGIDVLPY